MYKEFKRLAGYSHALMAELNLLIGSNWFLQFLVVFKSWDRTYQIKSNRNTGLHVKFGGSAFT